LLSPKANSIRAEQRFGGKKVDYPRKEIPSNGKPKTTEKRFKADESPRAGKSETQEKGTEIGEDLSQSVSGSHLR